MQSYQTQSASLQQKDDVQQTHAARVQQFTKGPSHSVKQIQLKPNNTGLPNQLKSGIEQLSGYSMDDVKVHRNSPKPAQLNAHAYAQGTNIHLGPGQEKHLPHEAWHVVQQKQGRVKPTLQMKTGIAVNDDAGLENEADNMGAKALQLKAVSIPLKNASMSNNSPLQMVLATVNPQNGPVHLAQVDIGGTGFLTMQNTGQAGGAAVGKAMGLSGVLDASSWSGFGKSPRDYHRAHAYAKSFGGGGADSNVAWWPASTEGKWTTGEQKVRGGGQSQIAAWKPGIGETGTYEVKRELYPTEDFKPNFLAGMNAAANWALDDSRPAWTKAIAACNETREVRDPNSRQKKMITKNRYRRTDIDQAKNSVKTTVNTGYSNWLNGIFGNSPDLFIKKMDMDYNITHVGASAGSSRANHSISFSPTKPSKSTIGLKSNNPEKLWKKILTGNLFTGGGANSPAVKTEDVVSNIPYDIPLSLSSHNDGWGT
jgi:hypothetical protein